MSLWTLFNVQSLACQANSAANLYESPFPHRLHPAFQLAHPQNCCYVSAMLGDVPQAAVQPRVLESSGKVGKCPPDVKKTLHFTPV